MTLSDFAKLAARRMKRESKKEDRNAAVASNLPTKGPESKNNGSESDYAENRSGAHPASQETQPPLS